MRSGHPGGMAGWIAALLLAPSALLAGATAARAEVAMQDERGFVVREVAEVAAPPAEVWRTLVRPAVWWSGEHTFSGDAANLTLDPVPGGCFCERLPASEEAGKGAQGGVQHMRVVYAEPGAVLRLTGALGPLQSEALLGTMTITLKAGSTAGTRILVEYVVGGYMRYRPEQIAPAVDRMLGQQLAGLVAKLGAAAPSSAGPNPAKPEAGKTLPVKMDPAKVGPGKPDIAMPPATHPVAHKAVQAKAGVAGPLTGEAAARKKAQAAFDAALGDDSHP